MQGERSQHYSWKSEDSFEPPYSHLEAATRTHHTCSPHVMNTSKVATKTSEQHIGVAADVEDDFWNGVRFHNPFQCLAGGSSGRKRLVAKSMDID